MLRKLLFILVFYLLSLNMAIAAEQVLPNQFISFKEAEELALVNSHLIASQKYNVQSASAKAFAEQVRILPTLNFSASSTFVSKIGEITFPQINFQRKVGEHLNWTVGPTIDWVLWDTWQIRNKSKSLQKLADSEAENLDYNKRQVLLNVRTSYINMQLAKEQVRLVRDALRLARAQYKDIYNKKEAGTADLLDLTVAHQEVVDREKDLDQARGDLAIAKKVLVAAMGFPPEETESGALNVESIGIVLQKLLPRASAYVDVEAHPRVRSLADKQLSSALAAKSTIARYYPEVTLHGSSTFEYPNLGADETIQQNRLMLGLSVPILDWGSISKESKSYKYEAHSAKEQKKQTIIDLSRVTGETRERIRTLKELRVANVKVVNDAVKVAALSYESYKAGRIIFLDVQRVNVKALAAKVEAARTNANLAIQISNLLSLAEDEGGL